MKEKSESRAEKRVLIQKDVTINGIIKASALDISEGGMYVHTPADLIKGATLELIFEIGATPIKVKAIVQHTQPGIGIGVRFEKLTPEISRLINKFIQSAPSLPEGGGKESEKKILLVDDNVQSRTIYRNKLNLEGFIVIEASNGIEALKRIQETKLGLVILDLWMEGIDGFKILQHMKLTPQLKDIPVIVLSARSVPEDIQRAISLGAKEYLPKVITTPIMLAEKVKEIFSAAKV